MTVQELIAFLQTQPQELEVVIKMFSEQCLFDASDIAVEELCEPRFDGWVQNFRKDKPSRKYLVFPGN